MRDITGQRFHKLTAIRPDHTTENRSAVWLFRCDCGKETLKLKHNVVSGSTKTCSKTCFSNSYVSSLKLDPDFIGKRFGRLIIVGFSRMKQGIRQRNAAYLAKCDCGGEIEGLKQNFIHGRTRSCGCLRREHIQKHVFHMRAKNFYLGETNFFQTWKSIQQIKYQRKRKGDPFIVPWKDFKDFFTDQYPLYLKLGAKGSVLRLKDASKPLTRDNVVWTAKRSGSSRNFFNSLKGKPVSFNGETLSMAQWARRLGITRERVRQLRKVGKLEERLKKL